MRKKIVLILGITLLVTLVATTVYVMVRRPSFTAVNAPTPSEEDGRTLESDTAAPITGDVPLGEFREPSFEDIEAEKPNGPWSHDLYSATSADGTAFSRAKPFVERAGVPTITRDARGRLVAAFQWFPRDQDAWDKIAVAFSQDDGATWTDPELIVVSGLPEGYMRPFDPTLTLAEDGSLRLFFTSTSAPPSQNMAMEIYSAIGADGVSYAFEGRAFEIEGDRAYDSAALNWGGSWHMLTPKGPNDGAYHGLSSDGRTFTRMDDIETEKINWTGNLISWSDTAMRFYGTTSGSGGIWWSETADGETWSAPVSTGFDGGDPAIVRLADGSYFMVYVR